MKKDCLKCIHYYVTWDQAFPRGCRALNFKTKYFPSTVVQNASGTYCLYYREKEGPQRKGKPKRSGRPKASS